MKRWVRGATTPWQMVGHVVLFFQAIDHLFGLATHLKPLTILRVLWYLHQESITLDFRLDFHGRPCSNKCQEPRAATWPHLDSCKRPGNCHIRLWLSCKNMLDVLGVRKRRQNPGQTSSDHPFRLKGRSLIFFWSCSGLRIRFNQAPLRVPFTFKVANMFNRKSWQSH